MKKIRMRKLRPLVQLSVFISLIFIVAIYNLYIDGKINFRLFSIGELNPYGGWSTLHSLATDSNYIFSGVSKSVALTISIIVMAIIGGRFFCGWLCPIGILQDFASWIGNKFNVNRNSDFTVKKVSLTYMKYPFLLVILLLSIFGYGSIVADSSPWRALLNLHNIGIIWNEMKLGFIILFCILIISIFISRVFCRYLCPLGAAQSLFSSINIFSIRYGDGCSKCNRCLRNCPVGLQFSTDSTSVSPECIRCLECVDNCKVSNDHITAISFGKIKLKKHIYIILMIILFFTIWIGLPQIWSGQVGGEDILLKPLNDGVYEGEAKGFAGRIITEVRISDGKIAEIKIVDHSESKGWYDEVFMVLPREIINKQRLSVDAISGATKTSRGLIESIENAIRKAYNK